MCVEADLATWLLIIVRGHTRSKESEKHERGQIQGKASRCPDHQILQQNCARLTAAVKLQSYRNKSERRERSERCVAGSGDR